MAVLRAHTHICTSVHQVHAWYHWKPKEGNMPWNWSYRWLLAAMWVLRLELRPSSRTINY